MKIRNSLALAAMFVGVSLSSFATAQAVNPSFEDGTGSNADNWFEFGNTYREAKGMRTGGFSMKMFGNFSGGFNVSGCFQNFPVLPGQYATASCYGISLGDDYISGGNWAILKLIYRDSGGNDIAFSESAPINASTPADTFQLLSGNLGPAPANTAYGSIFMLYLQPEFAGGSVFFDDVAVTVGTGRTVSGKVVFEGVDPALQPTSARVEFRNPTTDALVATANPAVDAAGNYTVLAPSPNGNYKMNVKGLNWLSKKQNVNTSLADVTAVTVSLKNGDVDGDDEVTILDYLALSQAYETTPTSTQWNPTADLDKDLEVTILDYLQLSANFELAGS